MTGELACSNARSGESLFLTERFSAFVVALSATEIAMSSQ
jgi:hypothetical protein